MYSPIISCLLPSTQNYINYLLTIHINISNNVTLAKIKIFEIFNTEPNNYTIIKFMLKSRGVSKRLKLRLNLF